MCLGTYTCEDLWKAAGEQWKPTHSAAAAEASAIPVGSSVLMVANAPTIASPHQPIIGHQLPPGRQHNHR